MKYEARFLLNSKSYENVILTRCESADHDKPDENWCLHDDVSNLNSFVYLLISHCTVKVVTFVSKQKVCKGLMYFLAVHWTPGH